MSNFFTRAFYGVDTAKDQQDMNDADRKLAALNQQALDSGKWDQKTFDEAQANLEKGKITDAEQQVSDEFNAGFQEGVSNIRGTVGSAINLPFRLIPWQGYAIIAVAIFVWAGGLKFLKFK